MQNSQHHLCHWSQKSSSKRHGWSNVRKPILLSLRQQILWFKALFNILCLLSTAFIYEITAIVAFTKIATI